MAETSVGQDFKDRVRMKALTSMLTTYGYTLLGGALLEPVTKGAPIHMFNVVAWLTALAMQGPRTLSRTQGRDAVSGYDQALCVMSGIGILMMGVGIFLARQMDRHRDGRS